MCRRDRHFGSVDPGFDPLQRIKNSPTVGHHSHVHRTGGAVEFAADADADRRRGERTTVDRRPNPPGAAAAG